MCFTLGYIICSYVLQPAYLTAPTLVGNPIAHACTLASHHNIAIKLLGDKEDNTVPPGTVLQQIPIAGQIIKPSQPIHVLVSTQQECPRVPSLIGLHRNIITSLQKTPPIIIHEVQSVHPTGTCFAQTPLPDHPLTEPTIIAYVSAGNIKPIIWPCFTGQLVQDILALLETYTIHIDIIHTYQQPHYHRCEHCRVIDQHPRPGTLLILDSRKPLTIQLQVE